MSALDLIQTIGRARAGTRMLVIDAFDAVKAGEGGPVHLPHGTKLEIIGANGTSLTAVAALGDGLARIYLFVEQYPSLAIEASAT
jgi:hypothetical protein